MTCNKTDGTFWDGKNAHRRRQKSHPGHPARWNQSAHEKEEVPDGEKGGHVLIFSWENTKIATRCWTTIDRRMWQPTKKIPHDQGQRRSPEKTGGGAQSRLKSNFISTRDSRRAHTKPLAHQDPGKGAVTPQETDPDLPGSEGLLRRLGSAAACRRAGARAAAILGGAAHGIHPRGGGHH